MSKIIWIYVFVFLNLLYSNNSQDLKINIIDKTHLNVTWELPAYSTFKTGKYTHFVLPDANYPEMSGKPDIPFKRFILAVPDGAEVLSTVRINKTEQLDNVLIAPVPTPTRDKAGIESYISVIDSSDYNFLPNRLIEISKVYYLRNSPIVYVTFYPLQYNFEQRNLTIIQSAVLSFQIKGGMRGGTVMAFEKDDMAYDQILNSEQAQVWKVEKPFSLKKKSDIPEGPWYRIDIKEDALYKIDRTALRNAGIDFDNLNPQTIKIYNNGGQPLNTDALSEENNPTGPVENAIYVTGESDGSFDADDFILFFGKQLGGWYYQKTQNKFIHQMHPYDNTNYYWLTFGGTQGKRMPSIPASNEGASVQVTQYMEQTHFEDDLENLLSSGADWYGRRMSGRNDQLDLQYRLENVLQSSDEATMRIKFKGGSGIKYDDSVSPAYEYRFTVYVNSEKSKTPIFERETLSTSYSRVLSANFASQSVLNNGVNNISITYTANYEICNAYLDWVEFYYPRALAVSDNQLSFYNGAVNAVAAYRITGFTDTEILLFDISDPLNVKNIIIPQPLQDGSLSFKLNHWDGIPRRYLISSVGSNAIKNITSLQSYTPGRNLLAQTGGSNLIIITHPSFIPYAQEIADLRNQEDPSFTGTVVSIDDIYFFFSSGVKDPVAIRNFLRHTFYNWSSPTPRYVLLFGDGHYDYRHIVLTDSIYVPVFEISADGEIYSRETDLFFADINFNTEMSGLIVPDLAIGRFPVNSHTDAQNVVNKLKAYSLERSHDGWQTVITFVADDQFTGPKNPPEWEHFEHTESLSKMGVLNKFIKEKIYLVTYPGMPGTFGTIKPEATRAIIDQLNEGTLIINYVGHGSNTGWAHESALSMARDLDRIQNESRLPLWIAATCTFGKFDDPKKPGFTEALLNKEQTGAIAIIAATRAVYSTDNYVFNVKLLDNLFKNGEPSQRIGNAFTTACAAGSINYQKFHLLGDPSMLLADPHFSVRTTSVKPDTLKALSRVTVEGDLLQQSTGRVWTDYNGGAMLIVNDARIDTINVGDDYHYQDIGARLFKGEVSITDGRFTSEFIVPKSIRYKNKHSGRITLLTWNEEGKQESIGYVDTLLFYGSVSGMEDNQGPEINLYFEGQKGFNSGDIVPSKPVLIAEIFDDQGVNLTKEVGHAIEIKINEEAPLNITNFFSYDKNSYNRGKLVYHLDYLEPGEHSLQFKVWDNLNNPADEEITFRIPKSDGLILSDVYNYPNPFSETTDFTFQTQGVDGISSVKIKIYTISGRLIRTLEDELSPPQVGFNYYHWDGRDNDGDILANGVYLYKIVLKSGEDQKEEISKLVILR
jgi:hypothetical protein